MHMDRIFHASVKQFSLWLIAFYSLLEHSVNIVYIRAYDDSKEYKQPIKVNKPHDTLRMAGHFHVGKLSQGSAKMVESRRLNIKLRKCPGAIEGHLSNNACHCVMEYYKSFHETEELVWFIP